MTKPGTCAALDPMTCRYHGLVLKMEQALHEQDSDAYLYYAERVAAREQLANPEEFFAPEMEAEDIASVRQLTTLINTNDAGRLPRAYRAELMFGSIYRDRYRRYAKQQRLPFDETKGKDGSQFVFTLRTRRDLQVLHTMIADGQYRLDEMDQQAAALSGK